MRCGEVSLVGGYEGDVVVQEWIGLSMLHLVRVFLAIDFGAKIVVIQVQQVHPI